MKHVLPPAAPVSESKRVRRAGQQNAVKLPRLNSPMLTLSTAITPKAPKWETWMTEKYLQDGLHGRTWIRGPSVIEPGQQAVPPLYGPSRELELGVGSILPTIFLQRLTPSDIGKLYDENQYLRNSVLDRMLICPICNTHVGASDKSKIQAHFYHHREQIESAGKCPSCNSEQWAFMTKSQKRNHLVEHQSDGKTLRSLQNLIATYGKYRDGDAAFLNGVRADAVTGPGTHQRLPRSYQ